MRHVKSKHLKKKKFVWKHCDKKFALQHNLKEHEYIHTQALPFVCGINGCTQSFRQRGKLCLHRCKHQGYNKRVYKKNADLNNEENEETIQPYNSTPMIGLAPQNTNFEMREPQPQRNNFGVLNSMNRGYQSYIPMNSSYQMGRGMNQFGFNNYQGMMNLDIPNLMQPSHRINTQEVHNNTFKPDLQNLSNMQGFEYESMNSDEESKEMINKNKEDELFLNPYSSMIRKNDNAPGLNAIATEINRTKFIHPSSNRDEHNMFLGMGNN